MAPSTQELKTAVTEILKGANLNSISAKKVRTQLEERFQTDLTDRKQEIDDIVMDTISASQNAATEDSDDNEENGTDKSESDDTYEPKSNKRGKSSKNANKRKKKGSSDEDDDGDADEAAKKKIPPPAPAAPPKKKNAGYTREYTLSPTLAEVVGAKQMPRHLVVKKIWEIVKTRDLRDPKDKRFTICDQQLLSVFGVKRFQTFSMMKYLKNHFIEPQ